MGLDSVDLLRKIEDHFSIRIPDAEAEHLVTVQDFYDVVAMHIRINPEAIPSIHLVINQLIADHTGVDLSEVQPSKSITSDFGLD